MECEDAVLTCHRNNVRRNTYCAEVKQRYQPGERYAVVFGERLHQFEADAAPREVVERIGGVGPFGVQYGLGRRHFLIGHVVVAYYEIYSYAFGIRYLFDCLYSAIEHDDKFHTCFFRIVYALIAHTISLFVSVGDIVFYIRVELLQKLVHQSHGRTSVHIVISVDHDALLASHGVVQPVYGYVHVVHQEWVDKLVEHRAEETLCRRLGLYTASDEQVGESRTHADFLSQFLSCLLCLRCCWFVIPFEVHYIYFLFSSLIKVALKRRIWV